MKDDTGYDWLDDPFDEKKATQAQAAGMTGASKLALGLGCLAAVIVFIVIVFFAFGAFLSLAGDIV